MAEGHPRGKQSRAKQAGAAKQQAGFFFYPIQAASLLGTTHRAALCLQQIHSATPRAVLIPISRLIWHHVPLITIP